MNQTNKNLALVMSGGGARGAYEAGVIHYIRTQLPKQISQQRRFDILCGSSVGAINACFLASSSHDLAHQGNQIYNIWRDLRQESVYKRDVMTFAKLFFRSFFGVTRNIFSRLKEDAEQDLYKKHFSGLLDTSPFVPFLKDHISWGQISFNIQNGLTQALCLAATNARTGHPELFIEKNSSLPYTGTYKYHETKIEHQHVMASSALPILFPAVNLHGEYYMDGGLRMNTPMSPAIQLGADRILVVGMHHKKKFNSNNDVEESDLLPNLQSHHPSVGQLMGKLMSSIFLDSLSNDLEQMWRINRLIEWSEKVYGPEYLSKINDFLKNQNNHSGGDIANRGLKKLEAFQIFPSVDIRELFLECVEGQNFFQKRLTTFERFLLKILDVDLKSGKDFLSYITFNPLYLQRLLELGFEDAKAKHDELVEFMLV